MPLPTIETPTHELKLPSSNKKIRYRPFLVKEEKVLIIALESKNQSEITNAVTQVLKNCVLTKGIDIDNLPTFDIEYLFLNIRAKSIGEDIKVTVTCPDDRKTKVPVTIYVDEIKVIKPKNHKKDVVLDDKLTLRMKYPSLSQFISNNFDTEDEAEVLVDKTFKVVSDCIDTIYTEEESWSGVDSPKKELQEFVEQLNSKQFKLIENFFTTMPKLSHKVKIKNPKTGVESDVILEGLAAFFN